MDRLSWERWSRGFGVLFVVVVLIAFFTFGDQPKVDDSASDITSFYDGDRGRILVGLVLFALSFVILAWFVGAIANALRTAGEGRLAATVILLTAVFVGIQFMTGMLVGGLSHSIAGNSASSEDLLRALNTMAWSADALSSIPLAGAILAASAGLALLLPSWHIWLGLVAAILIVLRGTNWASDGFWAPSGDYALITIAAALLWTLVTSVLLYRAPIAEEPTMTPRPATTAA
jgi:hypothetical protein